MLIAASLCNTATSPMARRRAFAALVAVLIVAVCGDSDDAAARTMSFGAAGAAGAAEAVRPTTRTVSDGATDGAYKAHPHSIRLALAQTSVTNSSVCKRRSALLRGH